MAPAEVHAGVDESERSNDNDLIPEVDHAIQAVVGLGGSAGSIGALQEFFGNLPADLGLSYVVVIHLSPDHESHLAEILKRRTSMPVIQVNDTVKIQPDTVYVIPPGHHLTLHDGKIELAYPEQEPGKRVAVDLFFRSLAATHRSRAMAVVLSGVDGDGAIGVKRIKEAGGVTIAQDPDEAEHQGMPRSAIQSGMIDWILPVASMPAKIVEWVKNERLIRLPPADGALSTDHADPDEMALREVLSILHSRTGRDFAHYKRASVLRRILRRLQVNFLANVREYAAFLRDHPGETPALLQDLLVSVTNFFRDPESFAALSAKMPALFAGKVPGEPIRVWVPGCATGEEPYSLMMLLLEQSDELEVRPEIQIFATDLDEQALSNAGEGYYPPTIAADVSPERLRRFFVMDQGLYRLKKEIREKVLFASHNVLSDAPFSRLDLVSCRNLLIYFNREAQDRVMAIFHFSLRPGGTLFLGSSEMAEVGNLFLFRDKKHRIFERRGIARPLVSLPAPRAAARRAAVPVSRSVVPVAAIPPGEMNLSENERLAPGRLHLLFIGEAAPPSVLINASRHIVHLSQGAGRFLRFGEGEISTDLVTVIQPALRQELRAALFEATKTGENVDTPAVLMERDGIRMLVSIQVRQPGGLRQYPDAADHLLVSFIEVPSESTVPLAPPAPDDVALRLEEELQHLRNQQVALNEDLGSSIEELRASNEELQAMNEEHRSAVEELETSQEELQATNEELITVNQELKHKVEQLGRANSDLQNFIASSDVATVFLSRGLLIKRYTPKTTEIFRVIPGDVGRPFADLRHGFGDSDLLEDVKEVLGSLTSREREISTTDGRWFLLRISPYRMSESEIDGVVLTFVDVTASKKAAEALAESEARYRAIVSQMAAGIIHLNLDGGVIYANRKFSEMLGYEPGEALDESVASTWLFDPDEDGNSLSLLTKRGAFDLEKELIRRDGDPILASISISPIRDRDGRVQSAVALVIDVTERHRAEEDLKVVRTNLTADLVGMTRLHELNERLLTSPGLDHTLRDILALAIDFTGVDRGAIQLRDGDGPLHIVVQHGLGEDFIEHFRYGSCEAVSLAVMQTRQRVLILDVDEEPSLAGTRSLEVIRNEGIRSMQATPLVSHGGNTVGMLTTASSERFVPTADALQRLDLLAWMAGDFIERARAEELLRKSEARLAAIFAEAEAGLSEISIDGHFRRVNDTLCRILDRPRKALLQLTVRDVTYAEDLPSTLQALKVLKETGRPVSVDKRYVRPDGTTIWANSTLSLLEIDANQAPMILAVTVDLTERKKSEAALRDSREHLERVMESVRDYAIIISDENGIITGWNSGAVAIFGFSEQEAIGQPGAIIFTPEDRAAGAPRDERVTARENGHANDERWHIRKNGERFWVSGVVSPLYDNGVLTGFVKVARDLTEYRLAEAAVRDSEARFRTLSDAVPQMVWTNNAEGRASYFNQRWFDYTGLSIEESFGPGWQAVVHPDDANAAIRCWIRSLAQGEVFDTEFRLRRADGEYRWFIGRNIPLHDAEGQVTGWFGTATNIENMKRAEEALRQSEERLRIALESAEMGAWDWDVATDRVTWNERHFYLLGLVPDAESKRSDYFLDFVHPDDRLLVTSQLMQAVEKGGDYQAEFRITRADDSSIHWMSGFGRTVDSRDGRASRMTGVMYDSTERKLTEEELRLAHDELESRVRERTEELSEALGRLREEIVGREQLEEARRELVRRLVTTQEEERRRISRELHDNLGQHMVAVKLGLDNLQADSDPGAYGESAPAFDRLRHLVDMLIKAAHRQAWELRPSELDHLGLEAALEHYFSDWSQRTGIDVDFKTGNSTRLPPEVEIAFYRVVQEALTNVVRHAEASWVKVCLCTGTEPEVMVQDNGKGFVPSTTTGRLGLLGMHERLSLIGGTLEVDSTVGRGTTIRARIHQDPSAE